MVLLQFEVGIEARGHGGGIGGSGNKSIEDPTTTIIVVTEEYKWPGCTSTILP